jgi:hypothetical protein
MVPKPPMECYSLEQRNRGLLKLYWLDTLDRFEEIHQ